MLILGCALAFALCFVSVPVVIALSWRIGAVDVPCDWRRMHCKSIPRAGGIAIFFAFVIACLVVEIPNRHLSCTIGGGLLMLTVGLTDDILCLDAWVKFFYQTAIATATVLGSGALDGKAAIFMILWVVTLTNAHNFIDGLDGLFAGCAAIEGFALSVALAIWGFTAYSAAAVLLSVSCLAFRFYNRYPAEIFAGDCGSCTVGFLLGMLSLPLFGVAGGGTTSFFYFTPLFLFAYPLTDLVTAVTRRVMRGKSPFAADRGHLHHRITAAGLTHPQCGAALMLVTGGLCTVGVLMVSEAYLGFASISCLAVVALMIGIRRFILDFS